MTKVGYFTLLFLGVFLMGRSAQEAEEEPDNSAPVPDIGCTVNRPALCPNGGCYEDYSFCAPVQGCVMTPEVLMCPSGACTSDFSQCSDSQYQCDLEDYTRCADGICRRDCSEIYTNGCPSEAPFYCPSGRCGRTMLECTGDLTRLPMLPQEALPLRQPRVRPRRQQLSL
jgi:hypothetical protein